MKQLLTGEQAACQGVRLARADVIAAGATAPRTRIVDELSAMRARGDLDARFVRAESEHSTLAACVGAAAAGARAFATTSAQGLALAHEALHWAAAVRLPIVMAHVNGAPVPGWTLGVDQSESLSQRDTGWLQFYCEDSQEVLDTAIQAFRIAESVGLPVMVTLDAFCLPPAGEPVDVPDAADVDAFLPRRSTPRPLDTSDPRSVGALSTPAACMEMRRHQQEAMARALAVVDEVDEEWRRRFGRRCAAVEAHRTEDAEMALVASGALAATARHVVDGLRAQGEKLGLVKVRMFRPFPTAATRRALAGIPLVAVLDRNLSPGHGGIIAGEIRAALYGLAPDRRPAIHGCVLGLGGRDVRPDDVIECIERARAATRGTAAGGHEDAWVGERP